jgi:predicted nucleic acid-binding protein
MAKKGSPRRLYWDSCIFIDLIKESPYRIAEIRAILDDIRLNSYSIIYTSLITVTEVAYHASERDRRVLDQTVLDKLDALWEDRSVIEIIEYTPFVARRARDFIRTAMSKNEILQPADAIQLASASWLCHVKHIEEFNTYDNQLIKAVENSGLESEIGMPVRKPTIIPYSELRKSLFDDIENYTM